MVNTNLCVVFKSHMRKRAKVFMLDSVGHGHPLISYRYLSVWLFFAST